MNWKPTTELPELTGTDTIQMSKDVLVWVSGASAGLGSFARGRCSIFHGDKPTWSASGFYGNWGITHWMEIEPPEDA